VTSVEKTTVNSTQVTSLLYTKRTQFETCERDDVINSCDVVLYDSHI